MKLLKFVAVFFVATIVLSAHAGDPEAGERKSATCAACHGQDGNNIMANYPRLAGQGENYLYKQLQNFKSGARENALMRSQVMNLTDQDMKDLAAFYASQVPETGATDPEWAELGERLYRGGSIDDRIPACTGCHGPAGEGMDAASWPRIAGQNPQYTEDQLRAFRAAGRNDLGDNIVKRHEDANSPEELGMMQDIAARLSDTQIRALSSFLAGLSK